MISIVHSAKSERLLLPNQASLNVLLLLLKRARDDDDDMYETGGLASANIYARLVEKREAKTLWL